MDTTHLQEFVYLAETLSFKRTAERFYVSRSVISRHLAALEEALGAKLVERTNHAVALTEVGEVFYRDAQIVLRDLETAITRARVAQDSNAKVVHIGYLRNAARPVLVHFVHLMQKTSPDLHLTLTCMEYGDLRRSMDDALVDIALAVNVDPRISRNYRSTHIYRDSFYAVMAKDNPLAKHTDGLTLDMLPEDKLLLPDSFVYSGLSELIDGLVESKSQIVAREYYRDVDMLYLKVRTEGYVAFSSSMNNVMFGDQVAIVPVVGIDPTFSVSAFYRDDLEDDIYEPCRRAFEACRDHMAGWKSDPQTRSVGFTLENFE